MLLQLEHTRALLPVFFQSSQRHCDPWSRACCKCVCCYVHCSDGECPSCVIAHLRYLRECGTVLPLKLMVLPYKSQVLLFNYVQCSLFGRQYIALWYLHVTKTVHAYGLWELSNDSAITYWHGSFICPLNAFAFITACPICIRVCSMFMM